MKQDSLLESTEMLDFQGEAITRLLESKGWMNLSEYDRIGAAYDFVRNDIRFGYNSSDDLMASQVLSDGYGQCNTKGTLLMALLRALSIPCRFHGFTIDNLLQKGAIPNYLFFLAPKYILHSWVEVYYEGKWVDLEGFILDYGYLSSVQQRFGNRSEPYQGYAIATKCLQRPPVEWKGESTYIQKEGIHDDFGVFDNPDDFYAAHGTNLSGIKKVLYRYFFRHLMNWNVKRIRSCKK
tara:strand:+ start:730 stop:1440 length:711 start_codon:yes stop_codon:yes gene_type:complete